MNTQNHSCLVWSKEDFNGDERLMNQFFTECNEMIIQNINEMKDDWMSQRVETYNVSANMKGFSVEIHEFVRELNTLIGRECFGAIVVGSHPHNAYHHVWLVTGTDLTEDEIERLNLSEDFIIN